MQQDVRRRGGKQAGKACADDDDARPARLHGAESTRQPRELKTRGELARPVDSGHRWPTMAVAGSDGSDGGDARELLVNLGQLSVGEVNRARCGVFAHSDRRT